MQSKSPLRKVTILKTLVPCKLEQKSGKVSLLDEYWCGKGIQLASVKSEPASQIANNGSPSPHQEVRCAVRFPLALPVVLNTDNGEVAARTRNVSASGVQFELDEQLPVGIGIRFTIRMPGAVLGTPNDVLVHCTGRVVRCSLSQHLYIAAATIDEYAFAEQ